MTIHTMYKILIGSFTFSVASLLSASPASMAPITPPLNQVALQLKVQDWVSTNTAKVEVTVNASVTAAKLNTMYSQTLNNLKKLAADSQWHITQFDRRRDQSGLEQVFIQAQTRLPETALANLRQQAKNISVPGITYKIANIDFTPSVADVQKVKQQLREKIYQQANAELKRLNSVYPQANFGMHHLVFGGANLPVPQHRIGEVMFARKAMASQPAAAPLAVSNRVTLTANVVLAARMAN